MTIEEAIKTALNYESRIRDLYSTAARETGFPEGKRFFQMLSDDEQHHFLYLQEKLDQWKQSGALTVTSLDSEIPPAANLNKNLKAVKEKLSEADRGDLKQMLSKALKAEIETSAFYRGLVNALEGSAGEMFARFLEIEENHVAAVEAELNFLNQSGTIYDIREFTLDG